MLRQCISTPVMVQGWILVETDLLIHYVRIFRDSKHSQEYKEHMLALVTIATTL